MLKDKGKGVVGLRGRAEPILVLLSDSYSDDEISVSNSRSSSCSAYTLDRALEASAILLHVQTTSGHYSTRLLL